MSGHVPSFNLLAANSGLLGIADGTHPEHALILRACDSAEW